MPFRQRVHLPIRRKLRKGPFRRYARRRIPQLRPEIDAVHHVRHRAAFDVDLLDHAGAVVRVQAAAHADDLLARADALHDLIDAHIFVLDKYLHHPRLLEHEALPVGVPVAPDAPAQLVSRAGAVRRVGDEDPVRVCGHAQHAHIVLLIAVCRKRMQLHPVRVLRIFLHKSAAAQVHHGPGIHAFIARTGDRHSCRRVLLAQRLSTAVHMQRHQRQTREHHADVGKFRIRVRQQLIAAAIAHRVRGEVVAVIVHPDDAHVLCAVRRLRKERQLRPVLARLHADGAVERGAFRVIPHFVIAVAHPDDQRRFALLARILNRPDLLDLRQRLHRRLRADNRAAVKQRQHLLYAVGRLSVRCILCICHQVRRRQKQCRQQEHQQRRTHQLSSHMVHPSSSPCMGKISPAFCA